MKDERKASLDLVRTCAIFFVVLHHSTSLCGALSAEVCTGIWSLELYLRHLSFSCVPLFIMLSGYLQAKKRLSFSYFKGIIPLFLSYTVISLVSLAAKAYNDVGITLTPTYIICEILNFTANDYAWYFEMYIGLFLLIPFLNIMYSSIKTRRSKLALIGVLIFLTLLPSSLKSFSPAYSPLGGAVLDFVPDFFSNMYPLTYYFIGSYFAEYAPFKGESRLLRALLALACPLIPFALCFVFSYTRAGYAWYMMNGFNNITTALTALAVFSLLYDLEPRLKMTRGTLKLISECTFEAYLFSFIFDSFYYSRFSFAQPIMILSVLLSSLLASFVLRIILIKPVFSRIAGAYARLAGRLDDKSRSSL